MSFKNLLSTATAVLMAAFFTTSCDQGDTSGGSHATTPGTILVADGNFGGSLSISVRGSLSVGGTVGFFVTALDPTGAPYKFLRITCDTEEGLALLEPTNPAGSTAGVEQTDTNGNMSGVLGGEAPGSFVLECRGPDGFQLVAKVSIVVAGPIPAGFAGFTGAGGGGLGGGVVNPDPDLSDDGVTITNVRFVTFGGTTNTADIDIVFTSDCDGDGNGPGDPTTTPPTPAGTIDPEPFGFDDYLLDISNPLAAAVKIDSVAFTVIGAGATSSVQLNQVNIDSKGTVNLQGPFAIPTGVGGSKTYAGTGVLVPLGLDNVTFTITGSLLDGTQPFTVTKSAVVIADGFSRCGS
jgi:hypothetical protein